MCLSMLCLPLFFLHNKKDYVTREVSIASNKENNEFEWDPLRLLTSEIL